jgi:general secretion pathway protein G
MSDTAEHRRATPGFTLVELLIVVVILGILAGIVVFAVGNMTSNAKSTGCSAERTTLSTALEEYKAQNGSYPADMAALTSGSDALLKSTPDNYQIDGSGNISAISGNAGGCT